MPNLPLADMPSLLVSPLRSLHDTLTIHRPVQWRCIWLVSDWLKCDSVHYWWWGHVTCTRWLMAVGLLMQRMEKRLYVPWKLFDSWEIQQMLVELEKKRVKKCQDTIIHTVMVWSGEKSSIGEAWELNGWTPTRTKSRFKKKKRQYWPVLQKKYGDWQFWEYASWRYFIIKLNRGSMLQHCNFTLNYQIETALNWSQWVVCSAQVKSLIIAA